MVGHDRYMEELMDVAIKDVLQECTEGSDRGELNFGEVVRKLIAAGIERYHADFMRSEKTYYLSDGDSETVSNEVVDIKPAHEFSVTGVQSAVGDIQARKISYKRFCERVLASGCVGYIVSLAGRRVVYYGRTGDVHVEWFPGAP
jgi:uncharacterized protein YbcV (DUF1398 family)